MIGAFLTVLLWTISVMTSARAATALGGAFANRWRLVIAILLLGALVPSCAILPHGEALMWLLVSGAVGLGVGDLAMYRGYELVGPRLTVLLTQCLAAPISGVLEWLWLGSAPRSAQIVWIVVTLSGVAMALSPRSLPRVEPKHLRVGIIMGLLSACGLALAGVLTRQAAGSSDGSGMLLIGFAGGLGAAFVRNLGGAVAAFTVGWTVRVHTTTLARHAASRRAGWGWLVLTAIVGPSLGVICYQWALLQAPAATVQAILALVPVTAMIATRICDGDSPPLLAWIGAGLAVAGAAGVASS